MKTIQVSEETYEFLKSCKQELLKQYTSNTDTPIFGFELRKERASYDPSEYVFLTCDHTDRITNTEVDNWEEELAAHIMERFDDSVDDIFNFLKDTFINVAWPIKDNFSEESNYLKELKTDIISYIKQLSSYEYESFCDELGFIVVYGYEKEWEPYSESFSFFESDLQAHIEANKHNMKEYRPFVFSNFRTPKMEKLYQILKEGIDL